MARDHARLLVRVNADREFAELDPVAQWLFHRLPARQEMNYAGVLPLDTKRWARMSRHVTVEEVDKAVASLVAGRYLIVDDETDEVLVRSLMRNDEVAKQPNVLRSALRAAQFVESPAVRHELAVELRRVRSVAKEWQRGEVDSVIHELDPEAFLNASSHPSSNPAAPTPNDPSENPVSTGSGEPFAEPPGEVEVEVEVGTYGSRRSQGGLRASEREAPAPSASGGPPIPNSSSPNRNGWPEQPCGQPHDPDRNCGRCARARREQSTASTEQTRAAAKVERDCPMCDAEGFLHEVGRFTPVSPYTRCDHQTDHQRQVADARDEAS